MNLSIVVPMFNESRTISDLIDSVMFSLESVQFDYEIVVVDDGSADNSYDIVKGKASTRIKLISMGVNSGKGAAVQKGILESKGDYILVQDADLEYSTSDIAKLVSAQVNSGSTIAVYGSRTLGANIYLSGWRKYLRIWPKQGVAQWLFNLLLTCTYFMLTNHWVTDLLTGYKLYPKSIFENWKPETHGFETDHEITLHLRKLRIDILEIPIHYKPRTKSEGKKIRSTDGIRALRTLIKLR